MINVVIKEGELVLPRAIRITTTQSQTDDGAKNGTKHSFSFTAYLELTTGCVFIRPGDFEYHNTGTILDQSVAYSRQLHVQEAYFHSYRGLATCIFTSVTAWLCHLRYHVTLDMFMSKNGITLEALREDLKRKPDEGAKAAAKTAAAQAITQLAVPRVYNDDDDDEDDDNDADKDDGVAAAQSNGIVVANSVPKRKAARYTPSVELPIPAPPTRETKLVICGIDFKRGRKSGKDDSVHVHAVKDEEHMTMKVFDRLFIRTALAANVAVYAVKGTPYLYPVHKAFGKAKAHRIIALLGDGASAPAATTDSRTSSTTSAIVTTTTVDGVVPKTRKRAASTAKQTKKSRKSTTSVTTISTVDDSSSCCSSGNNDAGETETLISSGTSLLALLPPPPPPPLVYAATLPAPAVAGGLVLDPISVLDKLRPQLKASVLSISPPRAGAKGDASIGVGGAVSMTLATTDGRAIFVPLPTIAGDIAKALADSVARNHWQSEALRKLLLHQPHLLDEARRGFTTPSQHYLIIAASRTNDDVKRMLAALSSPAGIRAVCDGVARGWTQLATCGTLPAVLPYVAYDSPVDDKLRYEASAPKVRRIGQRIAMADGTTLAQWGIQATELICDKEEIGVYSGCVVVGGIVELSAEQSVYELAGFPTGEAEDAFALTVRVGDARRVISARGHEHFGVLMAYINCCGPNHPELANCVWHDGTTSVRATRTIAPGEFLCIDYGREYYSRMLLQTPIGVPQGADENLPLVAASLVAAAPLPAVEFDAHAAGITFASAPSSPHCDFSDTWSLQPLSVSLGALDDDHYAASVHAHFADLLLERDADVASLFADADTMRCDHSVLQHPDGVNMLVELPVDVRADTQPLREMTTDEAVDEFFAFDRERAPTPVSDGMWDPSLLEFLNSEQFEQLAF